MKIENKYDFRKALLTVHESNIRCTDRRAKDNEFELKDGTLIWISDSASEVVKTAAEDFADYLKTSMGISPAFTKAKEKASVTVELAAEAGVDLGEVNCYRGFKVVTDEKAIRVYGFDDRGASQALYYVEDLMTFEKAPVMTYGSVSKKPAFSPQMVHSGYGFDEFPDEYLMRIAHEGRDAILVYTVEVNKSKVGYIDFNDLIARANKYGLDVYAYSCMVNKFHPEEEGAEAYYESTYGRLFRECPGLKGITLVGESIEFPSKDPHIGGRNRFDNKVDGIPTGKPSPGWYPCYDYPDFLNCIKKIIRKYKPDADIVFWTYNWGRRPKEARLKLIESLPADITLEANFETGDPMFYDGVRGYVSDYSLSVTGPGGYFSSEAEAAKKRGIKLYSMTNTGGRTWDFGVIPYEPMPYQWIKRYKNMFKAKADWNLSGIMESHHYGFQPSFISKLSKHCFLEPREPMEDILKKILVSEFGEMRYNEVNKSLEILSDAITGFTPSVADLYGAFRIGPSYPFNLYAQLFVPDEPGACYGAKISAPRYRTIPVYSEWPVSLKIRKETEYLEKMLEKCAEAVRILEGIEAKNEKTEKLLNLIKFIKNSVKTGINAKKWYMLICRMNIEEDRMNLLKIFDEMETLLNAEIRNAEDTIPLVEADSSLGFEPSMLYATDRWRIEWKIRQIRFVIDSELADYRKGASRPMGE